MSMREFADLIYAGNDYDAKETIEYYNILLEEYKDEPERLLQDVLFSRNKLAQEEQLCPNCGEELEPTNELDPREYAGSDCYETFYIGKCPRCRRNKIDNI